MNFYLTFRIVTLNLKPSYMNKRADLNAEQIEVHKAYKMIRMKDLTSWVCSPKEFIKYIDIFTLFVLAHSQCILFIQPVHGS